jgi:hypothetical protein
MSLSGFSQSNGNFAVTVYENTGEGRATSVSLALAFSPAVGNVSYDYSVGPFTTADPSGGHLAQGSVTGSQPVARVSFTIANPGSVTATVAGSSYLKGTTADGKSIVNYDIAGNSAVFTYTAPANNPAPTPNQPTTTAPTSNNTTSTNRAATTATANSSTTAATTAPSQTETPVNEVKGEETTVADSNGKDDAKTDESEKASGKASIWAGIMVALAAGAAFIAGRRYVTHRAAMAKAASQAKEAAMAAAAAKKTKAKNKKQPRKRA